MLEGIIFFGFIFWDIFNQPRQCSYTLVEIFDPENMGKLYMMLQKMLENKSKLKVW
jgi:hypothetical protein